MRTEKKIFVIFLLIFCKADLLVGQSLYTFTGDGNWSLINNWSNNSMPPAILPNGSEIVIDPISTGECVLDVQQTISSGAILTIKSDKKFRIPGNFTLYRPSDTSANLGMLKKVNIHFDFSEGGYSDQNEEFEYNADTLVIKRTATSYDSFISPNASSLQTYTTYFFYAFHEKKPYKDSTIKIRSSENNITTSYSVTNYYYDTQDRISKSESFSGDNLLVRKMYSYVGNKRIENYFTNAYGSYLLYAIDTFTLNLKNEVTSQDHYFAPYNGVFIEEHRVFAYDTRKNPYADLNIIKHATFGTDSAYYSNKKNYQSPHNLQSMAGGFESASFPYQYDYIYIYNDKNYPVSNTQTFNSEGILSVSKSSFEYY